MSKWQDEGDKEGLFWKFVATLIPQIDPTSKEKDELVYEHDKDDGEAGANQKFDGKHRGKACWCTASYRNYSVKHACM